MAFQFRMGKDGKPLWIRFRYLIYPRHQLQIVLYFLVFPIIANCFFYLKVKALIELIFLEFQQFPHQSLPGIKISASDVLLPGEMARLNLLFIAYCGIMVFFLFFGGILVTHRIFGPAYKIKMHIRDYLDGKNPGEVHLRKNDFFRDIADAINEFLRKK